LALVYHLRISKTTDDSKQGLDRQEQTFAFIYIKEEIRKKDKTKAGEETERNEGRSGWCGSICRKKTDEDKVIGGESTSVETKTAEKILNEYLFDIIRFYQEEQPDAGITPMLFISALLKWYGFKAAETVVKGFALLTENDEMLLKQDKDLRIGSIKEKAKKCDDMNKQLTVLNKSLTGVRSRVNYVAESAGDMIRDSCTMVKFIKAEIRHPGFDIAFGKRQSVLRDLDILDSVRFVMRDNDKFDLIERAMKQYSIDIKSLKAHLTINIGLVSYCRKINT
jgi:hypothetical protein